MWMVRAVSSRKKHLELFEVHKKYGELARVSPKILLTADPGSGTHDIDISAV
jgi:hypothetical protein